MFSPHGAGEADTWPCALNVVGKLLSTLEGLEVVAQRPRLSDGHPQAMIS